MDAPIMYLCTYVTCNGFVFSCCINFQVTGMEISRFGSAIVTLSDKNELCLWNPLSTQHQQMNDPDCFLNITPEHKFNIDYAEGRHRSISFSHDEKYVLVPSFSNSRLQMISMPIPATPLKHLCRLAIRQVIPKSADLRQLQLPPRLISYLSYNIFC